VDIGEKYLPLPHKSFLPAAMLGGVYLRSHDMANRPSDLADRMKESRESSDPHVTFTLPLADARLKAREILDQSAQGGISAIVENWRQLPDGKIEFTMRRVVTAD
jgi:hypothetical protein